MNRKSKCVQNNGFIQKPKSLPFPYYLFKLCFVDFVDLYKTEETAPLQGVTEVQKRSHYWQLLGEDQCKAIF